mmetsp:Transcript_4156/g.5416  ORF Transcript_4156/g.5416 Transcript_4156/m.5416 type:complete len:202 (+) Transcript_4156:505-1110(+)
MGGVGSRFGRGDLGNGFCCFICIVIISAFGIVSSILLGPIPSFVRPTILRLGLFLQPALLSIAPLTLVQQFAPLQLGLLLLQLHENLFLLDNGSALFGHDLLEQISVDYRVFHQSAAASIVLFDLDGNFIRCEFRGEIFCLDVGFEDLNFHKVVVLVVLVFGHARHDAAVDRTGFSGGGGMIARLFRWGRRSRRRCCRRRG